MRKTAVLVMMMIFESASARVPDHFPNLFYESTTFSVNEVVLGRTCYSMVSPETGLDCNPAFLASHQKKGFTALLGATGSSSSVKDYASALRNEDSFEVLRMGLTQDRPLLAHAALPIWYQKEWWAVSLTPARLAVVSDTVNPVLPVLRTHALAETEVAGKFGLFMASDPRFRVGANLRYLSSYFYRDEVEILPVSIGSKEIKVGEAQTVLVEPGASFTLESPWKPTFSATITDIKIYEDGDRTERTPTLEIGYMTSPEFFGGHFQNTIHYTSRKDRHSVEERLSWGGLLNLDSTAAVSFLLSQSSNGAGIQGQFGSLLVGAFYKSYKLNFNGYERERVSHIGYQMGLGF